MLFVLDWGRVGNDPPSGVRFWVTGQKTLGNIAKDNSLSPDQTRGTMSHKGRKWCGHRSTWATKTLSRSATDPNRNPKFCLPVIQFFFANWLSPGGVSHRDFTVLSITSRQL